MDTDDIETITTLEAAALLGISDRTLRRRIATADIHPVVVGKAPGEQNRYDKAAILALGREKRPDTGSQDMAVIPHDGQGLDRETLNAAIMAVKQELLGVSDKTSARMTDIETKVDRLQESLDRIESLLAKQEEEVAEKPPEAPVEEPPKKGFWARLVASLGDSNHG